MMNLCILTENEYQGGLDTFMINLANAWPDATARMTVVCNEAHPGLDTIRGRAGRLDHVLTYRLILGSRLARGATVRSYVLSRAIRAASTLLQLALQYPVLAPWYILRFTLLFRKSDFTHLLVVNGGYPASLVCRCACVAWRFSGQSRRAVLSFHNFYQRPSKLGALPERLLDRLVARSCSTVVSVSRSCLESLTANPAFQDLPLLVIENGIEDAAVAADASDCGAEMRGMPKRYCLLLATLEERKGHEFALRAFRLVADRYPDVHFYMFGQGTRRDQRRVIALIDELGLRDRAFLRGFTLCNLALLRGAAALLVPSQAYESFGLTIIEAMALSRPVVATDTGGIPQVLQGTGAGTVVSSSDHVAFSEAVSEILADEELAGRMGRQGRKSFETRFTAARMASAYHETLCRSSPSNP